MAVIESEVVKYGNVYVCAHMNAINPVWGPILDVPGRKVCETMPISTVTVIIYSAVPVAAPNSLFTMS